MSSEFVETDSFMRLREYNILENASAYPFLCWGFPKQHARRVYGN